MLDIITFSLVLESSTTHVRNMPLVLNGLGFSKTSAVCRGANTTTWYTTEIISDLYLQCHSPVSGTIEVKFEGLVDSLYSKVNVYE